MTRAAPPLRAPMGRVGVAVGAAPEWMLWPAGSGIRTGDQRPWAVAVIAVTIGGMALILAYRCWGHRRRMGGGARGPHRPGSGWLGAVTVDNRRVVLQEWLAEAFTMWGIAAMVIVATSVGGAADSDVRVWVDRVATGLLVALRALTALTGAHPGGLVQWRPTRPSVRRGSVQCMGNVHCRAEWAIMRLDERCGWVSRPGRMR